jgi:predicted 2-oxoglutarate/Fe(II)-dependent dioxygenase YbiX
MNEMPLLQQKILNDLMVISDFANEPTCRRLITVHSRFADVSDTSDNGLYLPNLKFKDPAAFQLVKSIIRRVVTLIENHFGETVGCDLALLCAITGNFYHTLHADNAIVVCPRHGDNASQLKSLDCQCDDVEVKPNHTSWRKYTALLYLDGDHEGGNIIFGEGPNKFGKIFRKEIAVKSGILVLSPSNELYHHYTTSVTKGVRYSMNMWFTTQANYICREWE